MRTISAHIKSEFFFRGCNPSFVRTKEGAVLIDTPQQPIDAMRWREAILEDGPIRYIINTEPHADHTRGNAYFQEAEVICHADMAARWIEDLTWLERETGESYVDELKRTDPNSVWLAESPEYPLNHPAILFKDRMKLELGDHVIHVINHPGHTSMETSVFVPGEGVVAVGDNIFSGVKTFLHEADPWRWLDSLDAFEALDVEHIIPGHGRLVGKPYLATQRQVIENWLGTVERFVDRGLTLAAALAEPLAVQRDIDPFAMDQGIWYASDWLDKANLSNIYKKVCDRRGIDAADTSAPGGEDVVRGQTPGHHH